MAINTPTYHAFYLTTLPVLVYSQRPAYSILDWKTYTFQLSIETRSYLSATPHKHTYTLHMSITVPVLCTTKQMSISSFICECSNLWLFRHLYWLRKGHTLLINQDTYLLRLFPSPYSSLKYASRVLWNKQIPVHPKPILCFFNLSATWRPILSTPVYKLLLLYKPTHLFWLLYLMHIPVLLSTNYYSQGRAYS